MNGSEAIQNDFEVLKEMNQMDKCFIVIAHENPIKLSSAALPYSGSASV